MSVKGEVGERKKRKRCLCEESGGLKEEEVGGGEVEGHGEGWSSRLCLRYEMGYKIVRWYSYLLVCS